MLEPKQVEAFHNDGFLLQRSLLDEEETNLLRETAKSDEELDRRSVSREDASSRMVRLSPWNHPGDTLYGMIARCKRVVDSIPIHTSYKSRGLCCEAERHASLR